MPRSATPQPWQLGPVENVLPTTGTDKSPASFAHASGPTKVPASDIVVLGASIEKEREPLPMPVPKADKPGNFMPAPRRRTQAPGSTAIGLCVLGLVGTAVGSVAYFRSKHEATPAVAAVPVVAQGSANIISRPEGAQIIVDGTARGVTPLKLSLPVGEHTLELQNGGGTRSLPLIIEEGSVVREYVDLAPNTATSGRLEVTSEPAGAQVLVDGAPRGATPLVITSIDAGQHKVTIQGGDGAVNRTVNVAAGTVATVMASLTPAGAAAGWVSVKAPFEMQILEGGQTIGTTSMDRLMLPAGKHDLDLVASAFEFKTTVNVQVVAGKTATPAVVLPKGSLSVNALPWAEVWLDGQDMGPTPLGNLSVAIGTHEVAWRHPQLGERRQTVKVTAQTPVRAGMDLTK